MITDDWLISFNALRMGVLKQGMSKNDPCLAVTYMQWSQTIDWSVWMHYEKVCYHKRVCLKRGVCHKWVSWEGILCQYWEDVMVTPTIDRCKCITERMCFDNSKCYLPTMALTSLNALREVVFLWHKRVWHKRVWHKGGWHKGVWHKRLWHKGVWHKRLWHKVLLAPYQRWHWPICRNLLSWPPNRYPPTRWLIDRWWDRWEGCLSVVEWVTVC